jgi:hypothetical protein
MLLNQASAATSTSLLDALSAAATANATSGSGKWLDVRPYDGEIIVTQNLGAVTGTIAGKLQSASDANGTERRRHHGRHVRHQHGEQHLEARHRPEDGHGRLPGLRRHHRHRPVAGERGRFRQEEDRLSRGFHRVPRRRSCDTEVGPGASLILRPTGRSDWRCAVLFDAAYIDTLGMAGYGNPVALGKATDFQAAAVGKTLLIGSTVPTRSATGNPRTTASSCCCS